MTSEPKKLIVSTLIVIATVIVVFIGIAIITSLSILTVKHAKNAAEEPLKRTEITLKILQSCVESFKMDVGRLPTESEGLNVLITRPADVNYYPEGGYLSAKNLPMDAWGHNFIYTVDLKWGGFEIRSVGPDGITGSNSYDDIIVNGI